jgi:hypothetical protein
VNEVNASCEFVVVDHLLLCKLDDLITMGMVLELLDELSKATGEGGACH